MFISKAKVQLEIEKKFLVDQPTSWIVLSEIFTNLINICRIEQAYLKAENKEPCARVRKTTEGLTGDLSVVYHFNKKIFVESGTHKETEYEISKSKYNNELKNIHPDKKILYKTRFVFKYNDQEFELDIFKGPLKGLAILEIELDNKNQTVELPPYLNIIGEVTKNKNFSNFALASK